MHPNKTSIQIFSVKENMDDEYDEWGLEEDEWGLNEEIS